MEGREGRKWHEQQSVHSNATHWVAWHVMLRSDEQCKQFSHLGSAQKAGRECLRGQMAASGGRKMSSERHMMMRHMAREPPNSNSTADMAWAEGGAGWIEERRGGGD